jgi:hypothetical protein
MRPEFGRELPHIPNSSCDRARDGDQSATLNFDVFRAAYQTRWIEPPVDDGAPISTGTPRFDDFTFTPRPGSELFREGLFASSNLTSGNDDGPTFESSNDGGWATSCSRDQHLPDRSGVNDPALMPYPSKEVCHVLCNVKSLIYIDI